MDINSQHFARIFWFCVTTEIAGLIFLAALIWIPVPQENQSMANIAIGFITATVIGIPLSYLLGGNLPAGKKAPEQSPGTTTQIDLQATTTVAPETLNPEEK